MAEPEILCPQCWRKRRVEDFRSRDGTRLVRWCIECRDHYARPDYSLRGWRGTEPDQAPLRVRLVEKSGNRKTGTIPTTYSSPRTCPTSCPWYGMGCYAEYGNTRRWWQNTPSEGLEWDEFCRRVARLPAGQLWRHNVAGDLPGDGESIDVFQLFILLQSARLTRGFTFTHKPLTDENVRLLREAQLFPGLVINLSSESLVQADALADLELGPVVVTVPENAPARLTTPARRAVMLCPAQRSVGIQCQDCGACAIGDRDFIIAFRVHGQLRRRATENVLSRQGPRPGYQEKLAL